MKKYARCPRCNGELHIGKHPHSGYEYRVHMCDVCKFSIEPYSYMHHVYWHLNHSTKHTLAWRPDKWNGQDKQAYCEHFVYGNYIATRVELPWLPFDITVEELGKYLILA